MALRKVFLLADHWGRLSDCEKVLLLAGPTDHPSENSKTFLKGVPKARHLAFQKAHHLADLTAHNLD